MAVLWRKIFPRVTNLRRIIHSNYVPVRHLQRPPYSTSSLLSALPESDDIRGPLVHYKSLVSQGILEYDQHQEKVAGELQQLLEHLFQYDKDMKKYQIRLHEWESRRERLRRDLLMEEAEEMNEKQSKTWFTRKKKEQVEPGTGRLVSYIKRKKKLDSILGPRPLQPSPPEGLYLYGNVGCGKTMLMDMFFKCTKGVVKHLYRYHFHEAMLDVHERMHKIWKEQSSDKSLRARLSSWISSLPVEGFAKEWLAAQERYEKELHLENILSATADSFLKKSDLENGGGATVLCFDEIQVIDVFAVVAISGIVSRLLDKGVVLVGTSNRPPQDLNKDGMQKEIFLKFLRTLEQHCRTILIGCEIDYRRVLGSTPAALEHYFWPLDSQSEDKFENCWQEITKDTGAEITSTTIPVMFGRELLVPESCNGIARFTFEQLCGCPVGAPDYIAIAQNYHTVFISGIPRMSMRIRDKARRFITLIDELYNHHCRLFCTAASCIDDIFLGSEEGTLFDLESFQFETDIEDAKLRRDVLSPGDVAPVASSRGSRESITSLLSGHEEIFAFKRAISRLIEMQTPFYIQGVRFHAQYQDKAPVK